MKPRTKPRKPGTVLRHISGYVGYVGCGCFPADRPHDPANVNACARAHFAALLRELRASLKERR